METHLILHNDQMIYKWNQAIKTWRIIEIRDILYTYVLFKHIQLTEMFKKSGGFFCK